MESIDFSGVLPVWHLVVLLGLWSQPPSLPHVCLDTVTRVPWHRLHLPGSETWAAVRVTVLDEWKTSTIRPFLRDNSML